MKRVRYQRSLLFCFSSTFLITLQGGCPFYSHHEWQVTFYLLPLQVDVAILEVGLGGRLDATNVVSLIITYDMNSLLLNTSMHTTCMINPAETWFWVQIFISLLSSPCLWSYILLFFCRIQLVHVVHCLLIVTASKPFCSR